MTIIDPHLGAAALLRPRPEGMEDASANALREFDAYFLGEILKGAQPEGEEHLLDGGSAGRMYRDHFYQEVARVIARQGGLGLTDQLKDSLPGSGSGQHEAQREPEA